MIFINEITWLDWIEETVVEYMRYNVKITPMCLEIYNDMNCKIARIYPKSNYCGIITHSLYVEFVMQFRLSIYAHWMKMNHIPLIQYNEYHPEKIKFGILDKIL